MAPRVLAHPGTVAHRPHSYERTTVDERILAQRAQSSLTDQEHKGREGRRQPRGRVFGRERMSCYDCAKWRW
jgi:hypothetical protein